MGKKSRTKGAVAENEVCKMLSDFYPNAARELSQYQSSCGRDLRETQPWCVQVKRYKSLAPGMKRLAYEEARGACDEEYKLPLVFYREDRKKWRVLTDFYVLADWLELCMYGMEPLKPTTELLIDMDCEEFLSWLPSLRV